MARPRPQVATTTAVLILFLVAEVVSSGEATTIVLRPPHGGSNRHTMFLLFFFSLSLSLSLSLSPPSSYSSNSSPFVHRQIQGSDPLHPNTRMLLYDDLLLNGSRNWPKHMFADIRSRSSEKGICPYTGQWEQIDTNMRWLPKTYALFVVDPSEEPVNTARTVSIRHLMRISEAFKGTHYALMYGIKLC